MKKKKETKEYGVHQHTDAFGNIFGMSHPLNAAHNAKTQKAHDVTVKQEVKK